VSAVTDSIFSARDVINLLIDVAVERPELLNEFKKVGEDTFDEFFKAKSDTEKQALREFFGNLDPEVDKSVWGFVTKNGTDLVLKTIIELAGQKLSKKEIFNQILNLMKNDDSGSTKFWFLKFWRLIAFRAEYNLDEEEVEAKYRLSKKSFERLSNSFNAIIKF
jgi:hypothetical protein